MSQRIRRWFEDITEAYTKDITRVSLHTYGSQEEGGPCLEKLGARKAENQMVTMSIF